MTIKLFKERIFAVLFLFFIASFVTVQANSPKREFRGAWIQCVNGQFQGMSTKTMKANLTHQLDELEKDGVNAIIFQVRAECDALYPSKIEPWSRFLTGVQGQAPSPYWDPLQWMIDQCHRRGMELHAWINPYRAKTKSTHQLSNSHIAVTDPTSVFEYDGQYIMNPALPRNREYIYKVVEDIVSRYDIDGFHIDDYFYPYPAAGVKIPDEKEFRAYSNGIKDVNDWRRYNVNVFIKELGEHIHSLKPWVKFGVSPFGIYRNKRNDPNGSETFGLQNYDELYADVLLWVNNGWVDYCVPQLYWEIGNKAADYLTLIKWWNKYCSNRPLYIGESVDRTVKFADPQNPNTNQMGRKFMLHNQLSNIQGTVLWYSKAVVDDMGNYGTMLRNHYWKKPALQPLMPFIDNTTPKQPKKLKPVWTSDGLILFWEKPKGTGWKNEATKYVVYRFAKGERIDLNNSNAIEAITSSPMYKLPYVKGQDKYTYVVTALNRMANESKGTKKKIKL